MLALLVPFALAAEPALIPVADRVPLAGFEVLTGLREGDRLDRGEVPGNVTVVNIWYEY